MKVPFLDLKSQYESIRDEVGDAIQSVLDKTAFAGGKMVDVVFYLNLVAAARNSSCSNVYYDGGFRMG